MLAGFLPEHVYDSDKASVTEEYEVIVRKFLDPTRQSEPISHHGRESELHYHDWNGAGHLADLAAGEGGYDKGKSELWKRVGGEEGLDGLVKRHGYLSALHSLLQY